MCIRALSLSLLLFFSFTSFSQDFPGFRNGNYTGVNGVFFNPANIADSRYRFDINLISLNTSVGNDRASFNFKSITRSIDFDSLQNEMFGEAGGPSSGAVNVAVHGPSLMFNTGKKSSVALTSRFRTMANIVDMDGTLANKLLNDLEGDVNLPYTISSKENMRLVVNSWTELGVSFARVLSDNGPHFLKGGLTLKYLAGIANGHINIDNFQGSINEDDAGDVYLYNTTGRISTGFGGVKVSDFELSNATKMESTGFGGDLGFVYEFRPDHENYKVDEKNWRQDRNKYKLKVGLALLDIGKIKYNKDSERSGAYDMNITGNKRFYLNELSDEEIDSYNDFFQARPQYFTPVNNDRADYSAALPSTLQLDVDYNLHRGFYTSVSAQLPLNKNEVFNSVNYSSFTFTPRFEGRAIGIYLPFNYNSLTKFNAGVSLRFGPLFIGSGSLLTAALGDSKQADVHFGLHIAGLKKNKLKKANKK